MQCPFCTLDPDSLSGQISHQPGACTGGAQVACDAGEGVGEPEYPIEIVLAILSANKPPYPPTNRQLSAMLYLIIRTFLISNPLQNTSCN